MKYQIYYTKREPNPEEIEHLRDEVTEAAIQRYMENRWSAWVPQVPTSGEGKTKEEARANAIANAYSAIAAYLQNGQLKAEDLAALTLEDSAEQPSIEEMFAMRPDWLKEAPAEAAAE